MTEHPSQDPESVRPGSDRDILSSLTNSGYSETEAQSLLELLKTSIEAGTAEDFQQQEAARGEGSPLPSRQSQPEQQSVEPIAGQLEAPEFQPTELITQEDDRPGEDIRALKEYPPAQMQQLQREFIHVVGHDQEAAEAEEGEQRLLAEVLADRPDILHLIKLDIAHFGPELYDMVMEQYQHTRSGSRLDRAAFRSSVRVLYAAGVTDLEQLRSFDTIEQAPAYNAELLPVEKLWKKVRFQRYDMKDDPGIVTGSALAKRNKQNLDKMRGETALSCVMYEFDLDDVRDPTTAFTPEQLQSMDVHQQLMARDVREFLSAWHESDTNGLRNQPLTVYKEVADETIHDITEQFTHSGERAIFNFVANKTITRAQAEAAGIVPHLHKEPILTPDTQLVFTIHGWHGDHRFGEYDIPPAMNALKKNGKPVVGIAADWWGINGNDSKDRKYQGTPLTNKNLGRTVRRFMRMIGAEGNPDMFVLRMGWSRGGMSLESSLIEEISHLERIVGHALSVEEVQSFIAERCKTMDIISAPAEPGSEWFIRRIAHEENTLDRAVPLLSGTMVRVGHLAQQLGLTRVPGLRVGLQKIIDTYTGVVLPPRNTIGERVGAIHAENFGNPVNRDIGRRQSSGMIEAQPLTHNEVRRLALSTHLANQLMNYGGKDYLIHAGILERNMAAFAKEGYRRIAVKLENSGHATPYETEILYFPFNLLEKLDPGDMNIIERYLFIQSRLNMGALPSIDELNALQEELKRSNLNVELPDITSIPDLPSSNSEDEQNAHRKRQLRTLRFALSAQFAKAFSGSPEKMSAIIQLVDYLEEMQLHFPEDVSDEALQEAIPPTSLVVLNPYTERGQSRTA